MSASSGNKLTDDTDIAKQEPKFEKNLPMSASLVRADIGKIYLVMSATSINKAYRCLRHC